jgi:hypothetical protein
MPLKVLSNYALIKGCYELGFELTCPQFRNTTKLKFGFYWFVEFVDGCWIDFNPRCEGSIGYLWQG